MERNPDTRCGSVFCRRFVLYLLLALALGPVLESVDLHAQPSPLPPRIIVGYWHNFTNAAGAMRLASVPAAYDVINVSFAVPGAGTAMTFTPMAEFYATPQAFRDEVNQLKAIGKKVLISIGGANSPVALKTEADVQNFVTSMELIITTYGFDGLDIDLEGSSLVLNTGDKDFRAPTTVQVVNFIRAISLLLARFPGGLILTAAPETAYVQGGYSTYSGVFGAYLPILHALRDQLTYVHVQHYNTGSMFGRNGVVYQPGTADFHLAMADALVSGFTVDAFGQKIPFPGLGAEKVAIGLPATTQAAGSGYTPFSVVKTALDYLYLGKQHSGSYRLASPAGYGNFRGVMTWSINWDVYNNRAWSNDYRKYLDTLKVPVNDIRGPEGHVAGAFALEPNYPNPFNPSTLLSFTLPRTDRARLMVYDLLGREVALLLDGPVAAGHHTVRFDAGGLPSGVYVCVLESGGSRAVRRMMLMR